MSIFDDATRRHIWDLYKNMCANRFYSTPGIDFEDIDLDRKIVLCEQLSLPENSNYSEIDMAVTTHLINYFRETENTSDEKTALASEAREYPFLVQEIKDAAESCINLQHTFRR